jgi:glycolate oxidase
MDKDVWKAKMEEIMDRLYAKGSELGGQVSGEHGIGIAKRPYLLRELGDTLIALQRQIKEVFDPKHILNPGKVI